MFELLSELHFEGLAVGLATFLIIGLFHPVVIKFHYYFGTGCWWWFLILGISMCVVSMLLDNNILSIIAGVVAFSSFWTIKEIFEQEKRVEKGWFPPNPSRIKEKNDTGKKKRCINLCNCCGIAKFAIAYSQALL